MKWIRKIIHKIRDLFLGRSDEVYYINGPDVLPPPLDREEEARLIALSPTDERARQTLVEHNLRLVVFVVKRFEGAGGLGIEELISMGTVGLIKAINTFRQEKNIKLATYASRCIENEILMYLRKDHARRREISIDEPLNVDFDGNELLLLDILGSENDSVERKLEEEEERRAVRKKVDELGAREKEIIELRFGLRGGRELTQKEVADRLGISQSYISRLEKRIIEELRAELCGIL